MRFSPPWYSRARRFGGGTGTARRWARARENGDLADAPALPIEPAPRKAEDALRQENDDGDEDHAERYQIGELVAEPL